MNTLILAAILAAGQIGTPLIASSGAIGTVIEAGTLNQADPSHGDAYLAIRAPRGTRVQVCGPAACRILVSTDYGPVKGTGKVADVALAVWLVVCGKPASAGVCSGSVEYPVAGPALPPTDTAHVGGSVGMAEDSNAVLVWIALFVVVFTGSLRTWTRRLG